MEERDKKEIFINYPKLSTKRDLVKYSILSWFLPPYTRFELQEVLRQKALAHRYFEVEVYLHSKELCAGALYLETDYRLNDVFGNILQKGIFCWTKTLLGSRVKVKNKDFCFLKLKNKQKPKHPQRKRGYNDHGSLPTDQERYYKKVNEEYGNLHYLEYEEKKTIFLLRQQNRILEVKLNLEGIE
jgi:hypothetical protein